MKTSKRSIADHEGSERSLALRALKGPAGMVVGDMMRQVLGAHVGTLRHMAAQCSCQEAENCRHVGLAVAAAFLAGKVAELDPRAEALEMENPDPTP